MGSACGRSLNANKPVHSIVKSSVTIRPCDFFKPHSQIPTSHKKTRDPIVVQVKSKKQIDMLFQFNNEEHTKKLSNKIATTAISKESIHKTSDQEQPIKENNAKNSTCFNTEVKENVSRKLNGEDAKPLVDKCDNKMNVEKRVAKKRIQRFALNSEKSDELKKSVCRNLLKESSSTISNAKITNNKGISYSPANSFKRRI
eukprot:TRINITY_DN3081_c0_g1_i11.p1 TRINITY_DN3081_c0_g1~~TRINITY_DN3081_c0_g1_i11.p1  ORF type:complete len:200 (-),score=20.38 TRINITY_DN3081_c0_g1_i11:214-813(-)